MDQSAAARFKTRLRVLRHSRGWTQEQAAESCGLDYKLYQFYELGIKRNPGLTNLEKIAHGYGLDISELLAPTFPEPPRTKKPAPAPHPKRRVKKQGRSNTPADG